MTAEAAVCRLFLQTPMSPPAWNEAVALFERRGPEWQGSLDIYYAYYATLALYLAQDPRWPAWNDRLTQRLVPLQRRDASWAGSWDPDMRWGATGGRVYTTALSCLCLETYYRYLPVYQVAQRGKNRAVR